MTGAGRYAPSPSGDLHIGNLRTALLAWLFARSTNRRFVLRIEDLDRVKPGAEARQLADLTQLGISFDEPIMRQSERAAAYSAVLNDLRERGLVYECFCSRKDILTAASAPHGPPGAYPQTCRDLSMAERDQLRATKTPALRLRAEVQSWVIQDEVHGTYTGAVDDLVLMRADGVVSYNLAVVVDDAAQGVDQVVRGDDLLSSAPRQAYLGHILRCPPLTYVHVPLVLNPEGQRLAKRDGAVTWSEIKDAGQDPWAMIIDSLGLRGDSPEELLGQFDPRALPRQPWIFRPRPN